MNALMRRHALIKNVRTLAHMNPVVQMPYAAQGYINLLAVAYLDILEILTGCAANLNVSETKTVHQPWLVEIRNVQIHAIAQPMLFVLLATIVDIVHAYQDILVTHTQ